MIRQFSILGLRVLAANSGRFRFSLSKSGYVAHGTVDGSMVRWKEIVVDQTHIEIPGLCITVSRTVR